VPAADSEFILTRNGEGAYVVSLPAAVLPSGTYRLRLVAGADAGPSLIGEYLLRVSAMAK
jgi:hypothetical protein